ncbi:MAG TPA: TonB-dependent receptor, partial [Terriglobales bacterium]|nr:TonB-dependent receptor [Terriglobales bacterium]
LLILCATSSFAQFRGSIRGVVTDSQGAVLPGTTVTLTNTDTSATMTAVTGDNGIYVFNALPSAHYRVSAEHNGFKKRVLEHVQIIPDQPNNLDLQLEVGQVQEAVTVTGTTETLNTETATTSGTIRASEIQSLPSFGRDVFKLVQLAPGVFSEGQGAKLPTTQGPGGTEGNQSLFQTENGPQAIANGLQYESNGYTLDGVSTTSAVWGGTTIITPSEEAVQDVKVVSNAYDAELGRFSGAQVQVTSKSGTNQVHGSAFFTAHRPGLNAFRWVGQNAKPLRDDNFFSQFGGSVGAPIWKNKIFGFFAWETIRTPQAVPQAGSAWYETSSFASSAPSGSIAAQYLNFPGSRPNSTGINGNKTCADAGLVEGVNCHAISGQGLDIGSPLTSGLGTQDLTWQNASNPGVGNGLDGVADIANFNTIKPTTSTKNQYIGRVDANITANDRLTGSIYWVPQSTDSVNGDRPYDIFHHSQKNQSFSLIWNRVISPTFVNEARFNAAGWRWNEIATNPQSPVGLPGDTILKIGSANIAKFGPNIGSIFDQWTYSYKDVATKVIGPHSVKFGGELTRLYYLNGCFGCGVPSYDFFNLWDFLNDAPKKEGGGFDPFTGLPATQRQDNRENIWGFFVQDDWKVRRNLTLNLGLRWSYFGPLYDKSGNMFHATPGEGSAFLTGLTVAKGNSWDAQKTNFGPTIGFAWSPSWFNDKLVVRGGYGLGYNQFEIALSANINANPGLTIFPSLDSSTPTNINPDIVYAVSSDPHSILGYPANPNTVISFGSNGLPTTGSVGVAIFPNTLPTMRVHHYSLDTQYDLGHNWIASLGYQGSLSRHIYYHQNPNAIAAQKGYPLNPQIGGGDFWGVNGYGNYNALLAELKHQFGQGFLFDTQFTWAKSLDTGSGPFFEQVFPIDPNSGYGPSDYDVNKSLKIFGSYSPNLFSGSNALLRKTLGGWTISGIFNTHTGFPWTPMAFFGASGNMYCGICFGYDHLPAVYLGGAGRDTSNSAYQTGSNFSQGGTHYFAQPATGTLYPGGSSLTGGSSPQVVQRNSFRGPGYRSIDATLAKSFGLPNMPVLGENAKFQFRVDAYNLFNNLNLLGGSQSVESGHIVNDITNANFGQSTGSYPGRTVTLGLRFDF